MKKCAFLANKIASPGHVILPGRRKVATHTTDAIRDLKTSTTQTKLRSLIGLFNVLPKCIQIFDPIATFLAARLRKEQVNELGQLNTENLTALRTLQ